MSTDPKSAAELPITRNAALDAARGILMMLGVVLHTANMYSTGGGWLVWDRERSAFFDVLVEVIHAFRMPAFFWISGYFCALTFERNGSRGLMHKRIPRLVIPLLATWLTLNLAQELFMTWVQQQSALAAITDGVPLYHLWFLADLMVYIGVAALVLPVMSRFARYGQRLDDVALLLMLPLLAAFSVVVSIAARATGVAYDNVLGVTSLFRLATYAPFFAVGIYMYWHAKARFTFLHVPLILGIAALPLALYANSWTRGHGFVVGEIALFCEQLMIWICVATVLRLFHDFVRRDHAVTRFLSDIAYSVYLFHHILVVIIGVALANVALGAWPKFLIVSSIGLAVPILVHVMVIRRSRVARLLFNGK